MDFKIITLEEPALYELAWMITQKILSELKPKHEKWVSGEEAMQMLRIKSKTTLQKFRDEGRIRFTQPERRIILYDVNSINELLEDHAKETF